MASTNWLGVQETGSVLGMRVLLFLCTVLGRWPARLMLRLVALYYVAFNSNARRSSQSYLKRMGIVPSNANVYRHVLQFAECSLDRLFFLRRTFSPFVVSSVGGEHIRKLTEQKRGAILLGAHLGSFEAMRAASEHTQANINVVGFFGNARAVNRVLNDGSQGKVTTRLLEVTPDSIDFVFKAKELVEQGEMLAILADRVISSHVAQVNFLGGTARFPTGPFILAASLKCPVYLTFGLYFPPNRYELHCEPFVDLVTLPRGARAEALQAYLQQYADRLAHYCHLAPYNWFNFFSFWSEEHAE